MQEVIAIFIVFIFLKLKIKNKIGQNMHIKYFYLFDNHSLKQRKPLQVHPHASGVARGI